MNTLRSGLCWGCSFLRQIMNITKNMEMLRIALMRLVQK